MLTTVTVAIDQSPAADRAIPPAVRLARALGATVELISLVAPGTSSMSERASLDERVATLGDVPTRVRIIESVAFGQTLADWGAREGRLLCLSTRGRGALGTAVFGSVAADVAHAAMTPFLMVGPDVDIDVGDPFSSIIGCVDGSEPMSVIADTIVDLRSALDASVYVVTVDRPGPISVLPGPKAFDPVDRAFAALHDRGCHAHRALLEEKDVAGSIASFAFTQSTPLLVVGTRQRGKLTRAALRSGALEIIQRSPVPVLVVPFGRAAQRCHTARRARSIDHVET